MWAKDWVYKKRTSLLLWQENQNKSLIMIKMKPPFKTLIVK